MTNQEAGAMNDTAAARLTEADRDIIAEARRLAPGLRASNGDRDRLAGWLLKELAGIAERLDGQAAADAPHVLRDVRLSGDLVLDPAYDPPWPGAGITAVRKGDDAAAQAAEADHA